MKHLKNFFIFAAILVALYTVARLSINIPYIQRSVQVTVNRLLQSQTNLDLNFGAIETSFFPLGLRFYDIELKQKKTDELLVAAAYADIRISHWAILFGKDSFIDISLEGPKISWPATRQIEDLILASSSSSVTTKESGIWLPDYKLPIQKLSIDNAEVFYEIRAGTEQAPTFHMLNQISGLNVLLDYSSWEEASLAIRAKKWNALIDNVSIAEDVAIAIEVILRGDVIKSSVFQIDGERVKAQGKLESHLIFDKRGRRLEQVKTTAALDGQAALSLLGSYLDIDGTTGDIQGAYTLGIDVGLAKPEGIDVAWSFGVKGQVFGGYLGGFGLWDSKMDLVVTDGKVAFKEIEVISDKETLAKGSGVILLKDEFDFSFKASVHRLRYNKLMEAFPAKLAPYDFEMNTDEMKLIGKLKDFSIRVETDVVASNIHVKGLDENPALDSPHCLFGLRMLATKEYLDFLNTKAVCYAKDEKASKTNQLSLTGQVRYGDTGSGLALQLKAKDFEVGLLNHFVELKMAGILDANLSIKGPFDRIVTTIEPISSSVMFFGAPLGSLSSGQIIYMDSLLSWSNLNFAPQKDSQILLRKGSYSLDSHKLDLNLSAKHVPPATVATFLSQYISSNPSFGIANSQVEFIGQLDDFRNARVKAKYDIFDLIIWDQKFADQAKGILSNDPKHLAFTDTQIFLSHIQLAGSMRVSKHQQSNSARTLPLIWKSLGVKHADLIELKAKTLRGDQSSNFAANIPFLGAQFIAWQLDFVPFVNIDLSGTYENLAGTANATLSQMKLAGTQLPSAAFKGIIEKSKVVGTVENGDNSLQGRVSVDFKYDSLPYSTYLLFKQFDMRPALASVFSKDPRNYAYLTLNANLEGNLTDWMKSNGSIHLKDIRAKYNRDVSGRRPSLRIDLQDEVRFSSKKGVWRADDGKPMIVMSNYFNARIELEEALLPQLIKAKAYFDIDAASVADLTDIIDTSSGHVEVILAVNGSLEQPNLQASFRNIPAHECRFGIDLIKPIFQNITMDMGIKDGILHIRNISAAKGGGEVKLAGIINLFGNKKVKTSVNINLAKAEVVYFLPYLDNLNTVLDGDLQFSGDKAPYLLSGHIDIVKAKSIKKIDFKAEVLNSLKVGAVSETTSVATDSLLEYNIQISARESILLRNKSINANLSTNLKLTGNQYRPILLGNIQIGKGTFFYKREFAISRGEITFDDASIIRPKLDIQASAEVLPYHVYVVISGTSAKPVVDLSVDPPSRDDGTTINSLDAVFLLLTGSLPSTENQSIMQQGAGLSEAMNVYFSQIPIEDMMERLGQDKVFFYPDFTTDDQGKPEVQANALIKVADNVEVLLKQSTSRVKFQVQVPIHENILFSGSGTQNNKDVGATEKSGTVTSEASVDLRFRFSFQ